MRRQQRGSLAAAAPPLSRREEMAAEVEAATATAMKAVTKGGLPGLSTSSPSVSSTMPKRRGALMGASSCPSLPRVGSAQMKRSTSGASPGGQGGDDDDDATSKPGRGECNKFLHEHRQREWLRSKAKHKYVDFSEEERSELRRYFDALAMGEEKINLDRLETMLISLGLARTRKEVQKIVQAIDTNGNGELDFEEYLEIFRSRANSEMFEVFKAMMEGRLGDPNLNFENVVSTYRRQLFLEATGATTGRSVKLPSDKEKPQRCEKILQNFATLQRSRYEEAVYAAEANFGTGATPLDKDVLPYDLSGGIPLGSLGMMWRGVAEESKFAPERPSSAERDKGRLGVPKSPCRVIDEIVNKSDKGRARIGRLGSTIVIRAPTINNAADATYHSSSCALRMS
mmetsp:Transcript_10786/g.28671  ORF Transcript_10786/g.28671 Transcript_10786/m.28671 type:complete len:399 (+) Transcript_10786:121-1317(+)